MLKRKPLIFLTMVITIIALFSAAEVAANDTCTGSFTVTFDSVRPGLYGGHIYKYFVSSGSLPISKISFIEFAIDAPLTVDIEHYNKVAYHLPGTGGQNGWAKYVPQVGIVTITPQVNQGIFPVEFEVFGTFGKVGPTGMSTKAGNNFDGCTINGPVTGDILPTLDRTVYTKELCSEVNGEIECGTCTWAFNTIGGRLVSTELISGDCIIFPDQPQSILGAQLFGGDAEYMPDGLYSYHSSPGKWCGVLGGYYQCITW